MKEPLWAVAAALFVAIASAPRAQGPLPPTPGPTAATRPPMLRDVGFDQRLNAQVPLDLTFRDEHGRPVALAEYFGTRPVVLALVYYECPMLCTQVLNGLVSALNVLPLEVGRDFSVVAVSFDPGETSELAAAKKRSYLERYRKTPEKGYGPFSASPPGKKGPYPFLEADAGWHFLTGEEASIRRLAEAVGFRYAYDAPSDQYAHAAGMTVLTPAGRLARYFYGIEYAPRDLRLALVEASQHKIGSPIDRLLLFCYHYDPATGTYGLLTMRLVRIGGIVTVLALGTFIVVMRRKEKRCTRSAHVRSEAVDSYRQ